MFKENVILTPAAAYDQAMPMRDGDDVSWMGLARVGDDQGQSSACALFGIANWIGVMTGVDIPDDSIIQAWKNARMRNYGTLDGGLTVRQAWCAAVEEGWLESHQIAEHVKDMRALSQAPLLGCYEITEGWYRPNEAGCISHTDTKTVGYHLVLIVERGRVGDDAPIIWIQNSWNYAWGHKGCGQMTEEYHRRYCKELWKITA